MQIKIITPGPEPYALEIPVKQIKRPSLIIEMLTVVAIVEPETQPQIIFASFASYEATSHEGN